MGGGAGQRKPLLPASESVPASWWHFLSAYSPSARKFAARRYGAHQSSNSSINSRFSRTGMGVNWLAQPEASGNVAPRASSLGRPDDIHADDSRFPAVARSAQ